MQNRYDEKLREGNQAIIDLSPANVTLRIVSALEVKKALAGRHSKVLEIGIGEGDLTKFIFKYNPEMVLDAVDISEDMVGSAKKNLVGHENEINYFCSDALEFLKSRKDGYDVVVSSWVVHNFKQQDRKALFKEIFAKLNDGGKIIVMDKIYPNGSEEDRKKCLTSK